VLVLAHVSGYYYGRHGIGQAIIFFPVVSFFFFPRLISAAAHWMSIPYFYTWCGLSVNLGRRSEMCCTRLAGNTGRKNDAKNRHLGTIALLCWTVSLQLQTMFHVKIKLF